MRFTLAQLRKLSLPYKYTEELDLNDELIGLEDILEAKPAYVEGTITELGIDKYNFNLKIKISLVLESAISLNEVPYNIELECDEIYASNNSDEEDVNLFDGHCLDTKEAILTNIIVNKPMRVIGKDEVLEYENFVEKDDEPKVNPAFSSLKDLLK